nr:uncharacterized protein LOC113403532 [Vanessa tameamea]
MSTDQKWFSVEHGTIGALNCFFGDYTRCNKMDVGESDGSNHEISEAPQAAGPSSPILALSMAGCVASGSGNNDSARKIQAPSPRATPASSSHAVPANSTSASDSRESRTVDFVPINLMQGMMQEMMTQLIQTTAKAFNPPIEKPAPRMRNLELLYVPTFDPDDRTDTVQVWCRNIDDLIKEYELSNREVLNLTRKNLRGRAAEWARRNYTNLLTWSELKTGLIETFADETRYYDDLTLFIEYTSEQAGSLSEYATRKWELAKRAIAVEVTEQRLVEAVISGMMDARIRSDLLRQTPKNLPQLIQSLNSYKRKRLGKESDHTILPKRFKPNIMPDFKSKRCHKCHKLGHVQRNCSDIIINLNA